MRASSLSTKYGIPGWREISPTRMAEKPPLGDFRTSETSRFGVFWAILVFRGQAASGGIDRTLSPHFVDDLTGELDPVADSVRIALHGLDVLQGDVYMAVPAGFEVAL